MFNKRFLLPVSKNYVRHWGVVEAVREIFQNAIDSDSPFEYSIDGSVIKVISRQSRLDTSTLLLGSTSKAEATDKIGSFGEGYKIAMLVLTREGKDLVIYNDDKIWTPSFEYHSDYKDEILSVKETVNSGRHRGLIFEINGLAENEIADIISINMHMWKTVGEVINTSYGQILIDHPGKLFVNGLLVCDTKLEYGYNVKPEFLKLERDRQTVSDFDILFLAKNMWFESSQFDKIAEMISEGVPDLQYANYGTPELVKEACYKLFTNRYPDSVAAKSQDELKKLVEQGLQRIVIINETCYDTVTSSKSYQAIELPKLKSPTEIIEQWFRDYRSDMRKDAIVSFKSIVSQSKSWKLK